MTFKIRKLYNVLVVGGMAAAGVAGCEKKETPKTEPAPAADPAKAATPDPKPTEPKVEPAPAEPAKVEPAPTEPAQVKTEPAAAVEPAIKDADQAAVAAPTPAKKTVKKKKVPAKTDTAKDPGDGAAGWS